MSTKLPSLIFLASFSMVTAFPAVAQNLYKYRNHEGVTVISSVMPSDLVNQGYTVLDKNGRIAEIVPPSMTSAQKVQLDHLEKQREKQARQDEMDKELLVLYGSADEILAVMNRKLGELDLKLKELGNLQVITENNIQVKQRQIEKAGDKAPDYLQEELDNLNAQSLDYEKRAKGLKEEQTLLKEQHTASAARFKKLNRNISLESIPAVSRDQVEGQWRIREDVAIDWNLDPSGSFDSFYQELGSYATEKNFGTWQLTNNQIILMIDKKENKDSLGGQTSRRVAEERRIQIINTTESELQILMDGKEVSLNRS
ncbi:hypothetical protein [Endozoicomonas ascidiicola]|uniref:hypothetical protein n=1 Tax=Endozoicomonas ascidiicola TaxID=1698521 RepID=UPI000832C7C0|nr:hypothetical protein [Endozoicomonas ascidiicola]